jgi:hypothetical protein
MSSRTSSPSDDPRRARRTCSSRSPPCASTGKCRSGPLPQGDSTS